MHLIHTTVSHISILIATLTALVMPWGAARAFDLSTYASNSVLAEGTWVRVSVTETGMHLITNEELRRYGFSDPSRVHV